MNIKTKVIGHLFGLAALLIAGQANASLAAISITPSTNNVSVSDTFTLDVSGSGFVNGATAGGIVLTWDASILTISNIALATGLQPDGTGTGGTNVWLTLPTTNLTPGELIVDAYFSDADLFGNPFPVTGSSFDFLSLDFTVIAAPAVNPSDVAIVGSSNGQWQNGFGLGEDVDFYGATVTVGTVPVPAAAWLFGSGLIGLVGVSRRSKSQRA